MNVIVTRPAREAGEWVAALQARGIAARALPLIDIAPPADLALLQVAWQRLAGYRAAMFVSANAAEQFCVVRPDGHGAWPAETRAWAPGPGTARALRAAGVPTDRIDSPPADAAQFDSESLWQVTAGQARAGDRVLVVRGSDTDSSAASTTGPGNGREWLAQQLADAGAAVDFVVAYRRRPPDAAHFDAAAVRAAVRAGDVWLFSSSAAVANLCALVPGQDWHGAPALATHARIGEAATRAGFAPVVLSRPALDDVVRSLQAWS
ncbi:uroporphyrinogen-III synthase [Xylophilus ampelinus]|uniref:Uroporphyrinogen-III synthase n=1 Tax=Xylophilus ampelinus TaxID=54067 RepID=A0A318SX98_9BURK|nr:uroporphyrinogen-III synthase [Xylophilus ampelinus]MCS4508931.1 uroporphyrinogen-III synthase [Xylophilus ampelinus]PYE79497.1 uroporphyrinogen-III synthase [Xylophilus ampelinus]